MAGPLQPTACRGLGRCRWRVQQNAVRLVAGQQRDGCSSLWQLTLQGKRRATVMAALWRSVRCCFPAALPHNHRLAMSVVKRAASGLAWPGGGCREFPVRSTHWPWRHSRGDGGSGQGRACINFHFISRSPCVRFGLLAFSPGRSVGRWARTPVSWPAVPAAARRRGGWLCAAGSTPSDGARPAVVDSGGPLPRWTYALRANTGSGGR